MRSWRLRVLQDSEPGGTAPALCSRPRALTTEAKSPRNVQYEKIVEGCQLQEAQAISVLHEMLQQSFNLFHTKRSSAVWDTTLLEQLRTGLHQQLDHLDACLGQVTGEEDSALGRTTSDWSEESPNAVTRQREGAVRSFLCLRALCRESRVREAEAPTAQSSHWSRDTAVKEVGIR
ncbi:hypothetical protein R6Z07M_002557 [Ovis aries]